MYDRRSCVVDKIFFMYKKWQIININGSIQICLRQQKIFKSSDFNTNDFIENIVNADDAFKVIGCERNSPEYWKKRKKDLFAMVFIICYIFFYFSAYPLTWLNLNSCWTTPLETFQRPYKNPILHLSNFTGMSL